MKTLHLANSIILDPESDSAPAAVVYGGLYNWEGAWLIPRIPEDLKKNVIFVLPTHYTNDCAVCLKELRDKISPDKISSYSLCGYSRGGIDVYKYFRLVNWKILGLIDPSAPTMGDPKQEREFPGHGAGRRQEQDPLRVLDGELGESRLLPQD